MLDRAYDRWEQLGGAAATRGPLFQFHMQPIGRQRRWREVVERAQFNRNCVNCGILWLGIILGWL